jgi:type II secretory pathway pseudopilin PulG
MRAKSKKYRAMTLIEIMVVMIIAMILVVGVSGYRYHAALNARKADVRITAARLAACLLNSWKAAGGYSDVDPVSFGSGLTVSSNAPGPPIPLGFSALDAKVYPNYTIRTNRVHYYATLSYKDVAGQPRTLNVCVAWMNDYLLWDNAGPYQSLSLTTYASD